MSAVQRICHSVYLRINALWRRCSFPFLPVRNALNTEERDFTLIVSLTSFPARLPTLYMCIKTLMRQTLRPDKIILYLGTDTNDADISPSLRRLERYGLTIRTGCRDIRPHKKYLYAMREFPGAYIVTVDDDLLYEKDMLEDLWRTHQKYPSAACARRVHRMVQAGGRILPYMQWEQEYGGATEPSHALFSTNGAGTLFPPHCLPDAALDEQAAAELCLNADDVWLKFMLIMAGTKVVWTGTEAFMPKEIWIPKRRKGALMDANVTQNRNDTYIATLEEHFGIHLADYCTEDA